MIRTVITKLGFVRAVLAVGAAISILAGSGAFAQEPAASSAASQPTAATGGTAETERIIVTGSNIPTAQEVGPNPVLNINRDLINKSGQRTTEQLIRDLPVANAGGVPISNNATGFTPGASTLALRGFDPRATLILLDGRRVAPYPVGIVGIVFVDLNSIPRSAIENIEILKDGASTTYGADAVAGVVNIKLRHDYHGAEATIEYGNTLDKDSGEYSASIVFGAGDENTNVTGEMNFYHRNSIANRDRGFSAKPPFLSTNASPENLELSFESVAAAGGGAAATAAGFGPGDIFFGHAPSGTTGLAPASDYVYTGGRSSLFNFNQFSLSFPETERYGGYVSVNHKIFGDQMIGYADVSYQNVQTHNELAPGATGNFQTAGQVTIAVPPHDPNAPLLGGPTAAEVGLAPGAFNPFNPFQQIISGASRARLAEFGNRLYDNETDAFLTTVGVKGDKLFDGSWGYDAAFRYSQIKNTAQAQSVSATNYNRILNANDPIFDPTSSVYIGTTVPYNPFGDFRVPIPSNSATIQFATLRTTELDTSKLSTLDFNIYTTDLFKLPAGGVGFAFGGQFRRENFGEQPDAALQAGDSIGNGTRTLVQGGRKSYAFYGETSIPIFSPTNALPGLYSMEFSASTRFEAFRNNDTNVLVPKVGLRWQPIDESLTLRATWGEGFREPSLEELYAGPIQALAPTLDPQTGVFEPETPVLTRSNPQLAPEDSRSFSGGLVFTPKFVPGLTLSADFWDIQRTGVVTAPTPQQVLAREASGSLLPGEAVERNASGQISRIILTNQNSGYQEARGVDLGIQYVLPTRYGTFTSLTQATYLDHFAFQQVDGGVTANLRGDVQGPFGAQAEDAYLKWKGDSRLDWAWKGFDVVTTVRYTDGFREPGIKASPQGNPNVPALHYVHQTWTIDVQGSYDFTFAAPVVEKPVAGYAKDSKDMSTGKDGKATESAASQTSNYGLPIWKRVLNNTTITLGCNNVFGQDPPLAYNGGGNADGYPGAIYDATGRFVYVSLTKKF
jgi:iron complex outermembrane receptor protein